MTSECRWCRLASDMMNGFFSEMILVINHTINVNPRLVKGFPGITYSHKDRGHIIIRITVVRYKV